MKQRPAIKLVPLGSEDYKFIRRQMDINFTEYDPIKTYNRHRDEEINKLFPREVIKGTDGDNCLLLFEKVASGDLSVLSYLTTSFIAGFGCEENEQLSLLFGAIGIEVGDTKTLDTVEGIEIPQTARNLAPKLVQFIQMSAKETAGRQEFFDEAHARAKALDSVIKKCYGISPIENIYPDIYTGDYECVAEGLYPQGFNEQTINQGVFAILGDHDSSSSASTSSSTPSSRHSTPENKASVLDPEDLGNMEHKAQPVQPQQYYTPHNAVVVPQQPQPQHQNYASVEQQPVYVMMPHIDHSQDAVLMAGSNSWWCCKSAHH